MLEDHAKGLDLQRYSEYQPTGFDSKGAFLHDQGNWVVVPVGQTRDSGNLDQSNFTIALKELGGESDFVQVHRFGHWGSRWFEIIIVDPSNADAVKKVYDLAGALADYPVLDDEDLSEREYNEACDTWDNMSMQDRIDLCNRHDVSIFAARQDCFPDLICVDDLIGC